MKIPCVIDLEKYGAKDFVQKAIDTYGKSKDINQLATTVYCEDVDGNKFTITQFHNNKRLVSFGGTP